VKGEASHLSGTTIGVKGIVSSSNGFSGYFTGGKFYVEGNIGIGNTNPAYKLDVTGNRVQLKDGSEWIAMRTDGSAGFLDLSYSGGKLVIQGSNAEENILLNPTVNKVGIRTWNPMYELDVSGNIRATGSVYYGGTAGNANGTAYTKPDYVFEEKYQSPDIDEIEKFIAKEQHLPWVTSAEKEKEENGDIVNMTRMAFETLETVENLQLQLIDQNKLIRTLKAENDLLKNRLDKLEQLVGTMAEK
jgi:hypothetical protein